MRACDEPGRSLRVATSRRTLRRRRPPPRFRARGSEVARTPVESCASGGCPFGISQPPVLEGAPHWGRELASEHPPTPANLDRVAVGACACVFSGIPNVRPVMALYGMTGSERSALAAPSRTTSTQGPKSRDYEEGQDQEEPERAERDADRGNRPRGGETPRDDLRPRDDGHVRVHDGRGGLRAHLSTNASVGAARRTPIPTAGS